MFEVIVNADDFGVSPGVNEAVVRAHLSGCLSSASIMVNAPYADEAFELAARHPSLRIGVHLNLTGQGGLEPVAPASDLPLLTGSGGLFRHGFVGLLALSVSRGGKLSSEAEREMRAQIEKAVARGIKPSHLDSHRHIHAIPVLHAAAERLRREYGIPRLRVVNESLAATRAGSGILRSVVDGGLAKYLALKTLCLLSGARSDTYFYSILHTTRVFGRNAERIFVPRKYRAVEINVHPGRVEVDRRKGDGVFRDYLLFSENRRRELETAMDGDLSKRVVPFPGKEGR